MAYNGGMKALDDTLYAALRNPQPSQLIALQEALLIERLMAPEAQRAAFDQALETTGEFYGYLVQLQSALTARQYSELASWLDISAVGAVAFEHFFVNGGGTWVEFAAAALSETLMVVASRQYVKAWETETRLIHERTTWLLRHELWRFSLDQQPDLAPTARMEAIRRLLAPALDPAVPAVGKLLLLGRLFQVLLLVRVGQLALPSVETT
jgi:hypothetical protein